MSKLKEIEEFAQISYMTRQLEEISGGENATIAEVISDLKEKGYTIKEVTGGTNSVTGVKLNKSEISMGKNAIEEITYEYEYASGTTVRYFVEVDGKDYEIVFDNGEITVSTIEIDLEDMDKLPEVTVVSSNNEIIEVQKSEEGKIVLTSKDKGGEVTITVTCGGQSQTCTVTVELFIGLDKSETNPEGALPSGDIEIIETDSTKGIVIKDQNEREWVWVEVPKTIFTTANDLEDRTEENLNIAIKQDLMEYTEVYRGTTTVLKYKCSDEWYSGCGVADAATYNEMYNKMINSVYSNGGFWIQRYEDGRTILTVTTAQNYASQMSPDGIKTSSLLFGIQWDLVCKYLEVKGGLTTAEVNSDSSSWGRYSNTSNNTPSAGLERNKKMNIYDFAGNLSEFTLEKTEAPSTGFINVCRGGCYYNLSSQLSASSRGENDVSGSHLYKISGSGSMTTGGMTDTFRATFY